MSSLSKPRSWVLVRGLAGRAARSGRARVELLGGAPFGVLLVADGGSPVDLDASFFVQLVIFAIAFLILRSLVFRPVMALFDAREQAMDGARREAAALEQDAAKKREHFETELRSVRQRANEGREKLRTEAQQLARELTERARGENAATLSSAKAQLETEADDARAKALAEAPALARQIAEKLLGRSVN